MPVLEELRVVDDGELQAGPDAPLDLLVHQLQQMGPCEKPGPFQGTVACRVANPEPDGSGPVWSDPENFHRIRIQILAVL